MPGLICFQVDPNDVWLRGDLDNRAYFPNELGTFDLSDVYNGAVLVVEGPVTTTQSNGSDIKSQIHYETSIDIDCIRMNIVLE